MNKKYSITVRGSQMHLFTQHATTTAVFKSSYCTTNKFIFDDEDDANKFINYYKKHDK